MLSTLSTMETDTDLVEPIATLAAARSKLANAASSSLPLSLHVGIEADRGGAGRVLSELMTHLPAAGIRFRGLTQQPIASPPRDSLVSGFAPAGAGLLQRLSGARRAIRVALEELQPEIISSHFAMYTAAALDLLKGRRNVSHFHGPWAQESRTEGEPAAVAMAKSRLEGMVYCRADRVIVLSQAFADLVTTTYGVDRDRVRIIPGSVDLARFALAGERADSRRALGLPLDRPILVSVRRLVHRMGLAALIDAMVIVSRAVPDVLLCLAGQGPLRSALEAQVDQLGLRKHVQFLGFIEEAVLPHLFYSADINVVPTTALEGFGLVAAEAMATGTPSMVTPVGGLPEVVGDLAQELIFNSCKSNDIAAGLLSALLGDMRLPSRQACRDHVRINFSSTLMAERTAAVYRDLIEER